jgi:hypothetical protein
MLSFSKQEFIKFLFNKKPINKNLFSILYIIIEISKINLIYIYIFKLIYEIM